MKNVMPREKPFHTNSDTQDVLQSQNNVINYVMFFMYGRYVLAICTAVNCINGLRLGFVVCCNL